MSKTSTRHPLPGYPVGPRMLPPDEIRHYFYGERVVCLRCGRAYKQLVPHLAMIREMTADEYRAMYGLPWDRGLTSAELRERVGDGIKRRFADGYLDVLRENGRKAREVLAAGHAPQRRSHLHSEQAKLNSALSPPRVIYGAADFDRYLQLVAGGMTLTEAASEPSMPTLRWLQIWRLDHPDDEARLVALIESMPFDYQARCGRLGESFWSRVRELRAEGLSDKATATALGVSERAVNAGRRKLGIT